METYFILLVALLLLWLAVIQGRKRRNAAIVNHRKKHKNKEIKAVKELAEKFIGKECLVYTIASNSESVNGVIKEVTDSGLLIEQEGAFQAVNLEYVTRIREWPRKANGKKKTVF